MVRPRMDKLELDITYTCGVNCINCNRMTGIAPGLPHENVTVKQIERLIDDSIRLQYPWIEWALVGGEPTTHPKLDKIIRVISEYRESHNRNFKLVLATHGHGSRTKKYISKLSAKFPALIIKNSKKTGVGVGHDFVAVGVAPVDIDSAWAANHNYDGCCISSFCGLGMNYKGYFPCAIAGAINRIFGLNEEIVKLDDVTGSAMVDKYQVFCRLCGHYRPIRENSQTLLSPHWRDALARYKDSLN